LPAPVRPHYGRTICLHGRRAPASRSSRERLARHFGTIWTPEYGRVHCELFGLDLDAAGLVTIAEVQQAMIAASLPWCDRRLIRHRRADHRRLSIMILAKCPKGCAWRRWPISIC